MVLTPVRALAAALAAAAFAPAAFARAQTAPPRAGVVIQLPDGTVREHCVDLGAPSRTGEELLRLAEPDAVIESGPLGAKVCAIDGQGCDFPAEPCWCRCPALGPDCRYWAYHVLDGNRWTYAIVGAAARIVRAGDVDGWAWGSGSAVAGAAPPIRTFDELCGPSQVTPGTAGPGASSSPTAAERDIASATPTPFDRPRATRRPTATRRPSATAGRPGTRTERAASSVSNGEPAAGPAEPTAGPQATEAPRREEHDAGAARATAEAAGTALAALLATAAPAPVSTRFIGQPGDSRRGLEASAPGRAGVPGGTGSNSAGPAGTPEGFPTIGRAAERTVPTANGRDRPDGRGGAGYVAFLVVLAVLAGAIVYARRR